MQNIALKGNSCCWDCPPFDLAVALQTVSCPSDKVVNTEPGTIHLVCSKLAGMESYEVRLEVHRFPDITHLVFGELREFTSTGGNGEQSLKIDGLISGYDFDFYTRVVFHDGSLSQWSTATRVSLCKWILLQKSYYFNIIWKI